MKISTRGEYGIRAMLYISMSGGDQPVTSHEIASRQGIPEPYLRQILAALAKDRLIQSNRGPQGGHLLARPAEDISLRDVLVALEGHTTSIDHILAQPCTIGVGTDHCVIREVFLEVKESVEGILASRSLADLARRQRQISKQKILIPHDLPDGDNVSGRRSLPILTDNTA